MASMDANMREKLRTWMLENKEFLALMDTMANDNKGVSQEQEGNGPSLERTLKEDKDHPCLLDRALISPTSLSGASSTPTYDEAFRAPKMLHREKNKLYGKDLLEKCFKVQHAALLRNYRLVRRWFSGFEMASDLRHNKQQESIKCIIHQHHHEIVPLKFNGAEYIWREEDIYRWVISSQQSNRKYMKRKSFKDNKVLSEDYTKQSQEEVLTESNMETVLSPQVNLETQGYMAPYNGELQKSLPLVKSFESSINEEALSKKCVPSEMDKCLLEMKSFEGLEPYISDEDSHEENTLGSQKCFSFTELLQHGNSKRVNAIREVGSYEDVHTTTQEESSQITPNDYESEISRKSQRKRKVSEKMKFHLEKKSGRRSEHINKKATKNMEDDETSIEISTTSKKMKEVESVSKEDMETILLKYMGVYTIQNMYFSLTSTYVTLKKTESSFRSYSKHSKKPGSDIMIQEIVHWLLDNGKVKINAQRSPLSLEDVQICK